MKKRAVLCLAALLLCLWGCASPPDEEQGAVLWFAGDVSGFGSDSVAVGSVPYNGAMDPQSLLTALVDGPEPGIGLFSPLPAGTRLLSTALEDGTLRLDLSAAYGELSGYPLTLAGYCLTLTLTQLPGVERVRLTVEGEPVQGGHWDALEPGQALLSGAEERPVEVTAVLYFPRAAGRGLGVEYRTFQLTEGDVLAGEVMGALLAGPESRELSSAIPEGTELRSLRLEDGVCRLDLSQALLDGLPEGEDAQTLLIYSIVNTLGNLTSVDAVSFSVEGTALETLGEVTLPPALEPDFGLTGR